MYCKVLNRLHEEKIEILKLESFEVGVLCMRCSVARLPSELSKKPAMSVFPSKAQGTYEKGLCGGSASATLNNEIWERNDPVDLVIHVN